MSVLNLTLGVVLGDIPGRQDIALKLLPSLLQNFQNAGYPFGFDDRFGDRIIRSFFHLVKEDPTSKDHVQSRNLALLIYTIARHRSWAKIKSITVAQFDLLMDYHFHICKGTNYDLINATFQILEFGPLNYPERMRHYIDTIIHFMREKTTFISALRAASGIRVEIASMTQDNESLREDFSEALALVLLLYPRPTMLTDNPFSYISFFNGYRDKPYLQLLCTLAQDPIWHLQLYQNGHFDNCLVIAQTLLSQNPPLYNHYAASVAHIFSLIDALEDETHPFFNTVQAYPRWPLVLHAWYYIFDISFPHMSTEDNWRGILHEGYLDSLPSLIIYARKESNEPLIALVEEVCHKLEERKQQHEQGDAQHVHDWSLWYTEISGLGNQICTFVKNQDGYQGCTENTIGDLRLPKLPMMMAKRLVKSKGTSLYASPPNVIGSAGAALTHHSTLRQRLGRSKASVT